MENSLIVTKLQEIVGYKHWFIKEQLEIPLIDLSHMSEQQIKEAVGKLGQDIDDESTEVSLAAVEIAAKTADVETLWAMFEKSSLYNSRVRYTLLKRLKERSDSFIKSLVLLKILCNEEIVSFEKEDLLAKVLSLCVSQANLESSNEITNVIRANRRITESAAQAKLIAEKQMSFLKKPDDIQKIKESLHAYNWVALKLFFEKVKEM